MCLLCGLTSGRKAIGIWPIRYLRSIHVGVSTDSRACLLRNAGILAPVETDTIAREQASYQKAITPIASVILHKHPFPPLKGSSDTGSSHHDTVTAEPHARHVPNSRQIRVGCRHERILIIHCRVRHDQYLFQHRGKQAGGQAWYQVFHRNRNSVICDCSTVRIPLFLPGSHNRMFCGFPCPSTDAWSDVCIVRRRCQVQCPSRRVSG